MTILNNLESLGFIIPEIILSAALFVLLFVEVAVKENRKLITSVFAAAGLLAALASLFLPLPAGENPTATFHGLYAADSFTNFFRLFFILSALFTVSLSMLSGEVSGRDSGEFNILILSSTIGMSLMAGARNLLMIYLSIEFVSILSYLLAGFKRRDLRSGEAALKYAIYGGAASGIMVYGMSLLYGICGSLDIGGIAAGLASPSANGAGIFVALLFLFAGFGYKIASVPFHMWCPDVYEGSPTPVTAFFSVGPKAAGFAIILRSFIDLFGYSPLSSIFSDAFPFVIGVICAATMTLGNLAALPQRNMKRLLAYSSIAHAGYMLLGITTISGFISNGASQGFEAVLFYLVVYLFMNLGAFYIVIFVIEKTGGEDMEDFRGLGSRSPFAAAGMAIFLFSLIGLPPLAGFIGKFYIFYSVISMNSPFFYVLALIGVVNSFISLFYYARVLKAMYLERHHSAEPIPMRLAGKILVIALLIPTLLLGVFWSPVKRFSDSAVNGIVQIENK